MLGLNVFKLVVQFRNAMGPPILEVIVILYDSMISRQNIYNIRASMDHLH